MVERVQEVSGQELNTLRQRSRNTIWALEKGEQAAAVGFRPLIKSTALELVKLQLVLPESVSVRGLDIDGLPAKGVFSHQAVRLIDDTRGAIHVSVDTGHLLEDDGVNSGFLFPVSDRSYSDLGRRAIDTIEEMLPQKNGNGRSA